MSWLSLLQSSGPLIVLLMVGAVVTLVALLNSARDRARALAAQLAIAQAALAQVKADMAAQAGRYEALVTYFKQEVASLDAELSKVAVANPSGLRARLAGLLGGMPPPGT